MKFLNNRSDVFILRFTAHDCNNSPQYLQTDTGEATKGSIWIVSSVYITALHFHHWIILECNDSLKFLVYSKYVGMDNDTIVTNDQNVYL